MPFKDPEAKRRWRRAYRLRKRCHEAPTRPEPVVCEVCERPPDRAHLDADHDHLLERFRGWVCNGCNRALGYAQDDPVLLRKLAAYIERFYGRG